MSIFIQEVLGLLNRNQKKVTLDKSKDWFEFGKLYQTSSLNNKSGYTPKMDPFVIKWGDFICQATEDMTRTLPGEGKFGYIPVYTDPSGSCNWDTLRDSIITQDTINNIINITGALEVSGDITGDRIIKIGGDGTNILLDDGNVLAIDDLPGNETLAETLVLGNNTGGTDILLNDADLLLLENGSSLQKGNYDFGADGGISRICGVGYEDMWQAGFRHVFDDNGFIRNSTNCFNLIPDVGADVTRRYKIGSIWTLDDLTNYICTDATEGAAIWELYKEILPPLGYTPVNKAGDTMLGSLILNQDPTVALGAATKQYVDNISAGIYFHLPVYTATTGNLSANYTNGTAGVGAKLTATANGAIQVDGESPAYLDRILVWQQSNAVENGIYDVTVVGDSSTPFELTRSTDSDNNPAGEIRYGDYTLILSGDTNGGKGFICNTIGTVVVGTTQITYIQYNVAQAVTPGYGLQSPSTNIIAIDIAVTQEKINLTTTGTGSASLIGNTLNIPNSTNYWTKLGNDIYNNTPGTVLARGVAGGYYEDAFKGQFLQGGGWVDGFRVQNGGNFYYKYGYGDYSSANTFGNASGSVAMTTSNLVFTSNTRIKYATDLSSTYDDRTLVDKAYVDSKKPYKVYTAIINQSGTNAPTVIVLENTLGGTIVWSRQSTGSYTGTLSNNGFTQNKTVIFTTRGVSGNVIGNFFASWGSTSTINLMTTGLNAAPAAILVDNALTNSQIEIKVYN